MQELLLGRGKYERNIIQKEKEYYDTIEDNAKVDSWLHDPDAAFLIAMADYHPKEKIKVKRLFSTV